MALDALLPDPHEYHISEVYMYDFISKSIYISRIFHHVAPATGTKQRFMRSVSIHVFPF